MGMVRVGAPRDLWLMQNCLGEFNLIYCLIYLDDLIVFSWTTKEHLHQLCVVFD